QDDIHAWSAVWLSIGSILIRERVTAEGGCTTHFRQNKLYSHDASGKQRNLHRLMSGAQQIHHQPYRARDSGGQLAKESVSGIDVNAFAVLGQQQPAF